MSRKSNIIALAELAGRLPLITEDSAALAFTEQHRDQLLYDHDVHAWFRWTGTHWREERTRLAFSWARDLIRDLTSSQGVKVQGLGRKTSFTNGVEKFAQTDRAFALTANDWNCDPYLLATLTGTVELKSGLLRAARPSERINKIAGVGPAEEGAVPERWLAFLRECTGNDPDVVAFLQRWCGYCLTGDTREHALVFCYGPGGNGKTVMLNTICGILGDYARVAAMETFLASHYERHSTDLAMLAGARLVTAAETEEGRAWAEAKIKKLTGGEPITARFMRCDNFTYLPQFKLMLIGNHEPGLRNVDDAARRRFNLLPFIRKPAVVDRHLEDKLRPEWPAILRWMIDGCLTWQEIDGLEPPATVRTATAEYFERQDVLSQWLEEKCHAKPGDETTCDTAANLFRSWSDYAKAAGEPPMSQKSFATVLKHKGFKLDRIGHEQARGYRGIRLKIPAYDRD